MGLDSHELIFLLFWRFFPCLICCGDFDFLDFVFFVSDLLLIWFDLFRPISYVWFIDSDLDDAKKGTQNAGGEFEKLRKQFENERTLKTQAVNKLAEIMNRKDYSSGKKSNKVSASELRKKEKENRNLQKELNQVRSCSNLIF